MYRLYLLFLCSIAILYTLYAFIINEIVMALCPICHKSLRKARPIFNIKNKYERLNDGSNEGTNISN